MFTRTLILVFVLSMLCTIAVASEPGFEITIPKTTSPPAIDGKLDDSIWEVTPEAIVENINTGGQVESGYVATAMAAYDNNFIYVAFRNGEPNPGALTTISPGHDQDVWKDDENEMFIEPALAGAQPYFQIMINAAGISQETDSGGVGDAWDPALIVATEVGADFWALEVAIPFSDLGFSSSPDGETWGWNFNRHISSGVDIWVGWATTGAGFHTPERFGQLTFGELASGLAAVEPSAKLATSWGSIKEH
jgi:hypothetical protein